MSAKKRIHLTPISKSKAKRSLFDVKEVTPEPPVFNKKSPMCRALNVALRMAREGCQSSVKEDGAHEAEESIQSESSSDETEEEGQSLVRDRPGLRVAKLKLKVKTLEELRKIDTERIKDLKLAFEREKEFHRRRIQIEKDNAQVQMEKANIYREKYKDLKSQIKEYEKEAEEKPFKCKHCFYRCKRAEHLKSHAKLKHPGL